jgi:hypothetical protein
VVESSGLLNRRARKSLVGSNPTLSAARPAQTEVLQELESRENPTLSAFGRRSDLRPDAVRDIYPLAIASAII